MQLLLQHPEISSCFTNPSLQDDEGSTPLHSVINYTISINHKSVYYNIPLNDDTICESTEMIKLLLEYPKISSCFNLKNNLEQTILHYAIYNKKYEHLKLLLTHPEIGLCFTIQNNRGFTPLHFTFYRNIEYMYLLLSHPKINSCFTIQDNEGFTVLHYIIYYYTDKKIEIMNSYYIKLLLEHPDISICFNIQDNKRCNVLDLLVLQIEKYKNHPNLYKSYTHIYEKIKEISRQ